MFFRKLSIFILYMLFSIKAYGASFTFPSNLVANTTDFVLVSNSGTTPSVSGFSTDVFVVITGTAGKLKILTFAGLEQKTGYCGYTADDASSEPSDCAGNSIDAADGIGFEGTQAEVNVALATLSYKGDGSTSSISITASATPTGASYNPTNGHYYKSVAVANIDWADARAAAKSDAQKFNGLTGYLANITTESENDFITGKLAQNSWIGGSDSGTEKIWKWMDGPEADTIFTCQAASGGAGGTVTGCTEVSQYLGWDDGEPNQAGNEDCLHMYGSGSDAGTWNDYVCTDDRVDAYIVEYGGMGGTATVEATTTLTITSTESTAGFTIFDVELETMIKAQIEGSNRVIDASTSPILNRINQPRKKIKKTKVNKKKIKYNFKGVKFNINVIEKNYPIVLTNWNIDFNKVYSYEEYIKLFSKLDKYNKYPLLFFLPITEYHYVDAFVSKTVAEDTKYLEIDESWSTWTAGSVTVAKRKFKIGSLGRKSDSNNITFGIDKIVGENTLLGIAYRDGKDETDVGSKGTNVKIKSKNVTTYSSWVNSNNNSIDLILGAGRLNNDLIRKESSSTTNTITGSRTADQAYGVINIDIGNENGKITTTYYSRIKQSYTKLNAYTEDANDSAAYFRDQNITTSIISIGTLLDYAMDLNNGGTFNTNALFEFSSDKSDSSESVAHYLSSPASEYKYINKKETDEIYKLGTGFDLKLENSWEFNSKLLRKIYKNSGTENTLALSATKNF